MRLVWALLATPLGCAVSAPPQHGARQNAVASESPALVEVSAEFDLVARLRELPPRRALELEVVSRARLLHEARGALDGEVPEDVLHARSRFLVLLGAAQPGFELRAAVEVALGDRLIGLYEPRAGRVLVADDISAAEARMTGYHELAHGLADQHFDLKSRVEFDPDSGDRLAALSALAEGDATSVMLDALARTTPAAREQLAADFSAGLSQNAPIDGVPPFVHRLLSAPYLDGLSFVETLRAKGGWAAVDSAWHAPGLTTEQIIHPEKFLAGERASVVPVPSPPGDGCELLYSDVVGEQALGAIFEQWQEHEVARAAACGWNGDRLGGFECPDGDWAILDIAYDHEGLAAAAAGSLAEVTLKAACARLLGLSAPSGASAALVEHGGSHVRLTLAPVSVCDTSGRLWPTCSRCQRVSSAP